MFDIETLRIIWWLLLGILLIGFAVTDGFDFGSAVLLPLVTKNDVERRIVLNCIGPFWEGNQVWIILGAGAMFAAWPFVYAVSFSGFYLLMLLLLFTMGISRPVSFKYRSKLSNPLWRQAWDVLVFVGGLCPAIIFGILMGNTLRGVPFYFDESLRMFYTGGLMDLLNPFAWWCGFTSLAMLMMHGGLYLAIKTEDPIRLRAIFWARWMALFVIVFFAIGGVWLMYGIAGFKIIGSADPQGFSNPLNKFVIMQPSGWFQNYFQNPYLLMIPAVGFAGALAAFLYARTHQKIAFIASGFSIAGIISSVGVTMFPFILPSSSHPSASLLVWDASSSRLTLLVMLVATVIFLPIITIYTSWVYHALRGKVRANLIEQDEQHSVY